MVRTVTTHLSNFIPSCLLSVFLSLFLSYSPLPSFIYSSFVFPLFIFIVCFIYFSLRFLTSFSHFVSYLISSFVLPDYPIPTLNPYLHSFPFCINADNFYVIKWYGILERLQFYVCLSPF
jgi:hypothetical protein